MAGLGKNNVMWKKVDLDKIHYTFLFLMINLVLITIVQILCFNFIIKKNENEYESKMSIIQKVHIDQINYFKKELDFHIENKNKYEKTILELQKTLDTKNDQIIHHKLGDMTQFLDGKNFSLISLSSIVINSLKIVSNVSLTKINSNDDLSRCYYKDAETWIWGGIEHTIQYTCYYSYVDYQSKYFESIQKRIQITLDAIHLILDGFVFVISMAFMILYHFLFSVFKSIGSITIEDIISLPINFINLIITVFENPTKIIC